MGEVSRLAISAQLEEVRDACDFVVEAAEAANLDERAVYHCQMAVDEALTNIIEHGYQYAGRDSRIEVTTEHQERRFTITIIDDSPAFNPLQHQAPDPTEPLDSRKPGGWGIYFIRKLMDEVEYERVGGHNYLRLIKGIPETEAVPVPAAAAEDTFPVRHLENRSAVISPSGRLDSNTSPMLEKTLSTQLQQGNVWLYVDMSQVEYIASSGLKVLVSAWRRAHDGEGDVVLSGLQPRIVEILEMVGFDMLFQIYPDLDAALAANPSRS
ncbi:MAG: anti-sigma factor antagonist [Chloroflexi bacterium]|jgi:serine/threonine-protein kinase RsbW|nr:anti-sigma factor antagonist [Chloroflexota bacterium]